MKISILFPNLFSKKGICIIKQNYMKKILLTAILIISNDIVCFSQNQVQDIIVIDDYVYQLNYNPLESYFQKHPIKKPKSNMFSTGLYRGYRATFKITDCQLFLKDIEIIELDTLKTRLNKKKIDSTYSDLIKIGVNIVQYITSYKSVIKEFRVENKELKINWITGLYVIPYGGKRKDLYNNFSYDNYILLEINKGNLMKRKYFTFDEFQDFKKAQYSKFKTTSNYKKSKRKLKRRYKKIICSENCQGKMNDCLNKFADFLIYEDIENYYPKIL